MGILVYYNLNHQCFKCSYSPPITSDEKIGTTDYFGRYYIQLIVHNSKTHTKISFKKYKQKLKYYIANKLIHAGHKLMHTSEKPKSHQNNWYMWRR